MEFTFTVLTSFLRTGRRDAVVGLFKEGANTLSRHYMANFRDEKRQQVLDIFASTLSPTVRVLFFFLAGDTTFVLLNVFVLADYR